MQIVDDKIKKFQELVNSYLDKQQTVEGHKEAVKRIYPELPIIRKKKEKEENAENED